MNKIALYARVSKDEASQDGSLQNTDNQLLPLRQLCAAMGWQVREDYIFVDRMSGGVSNRPEFQRMLAEVRQMHVDLILVWSLDRFSREPMINTLNYITQLKRYKCGLKSMQESWLDTSNEGVGELLIAIFSWVANMEKKKISERTKAGIARLREQYPDRHFGRPRKGGSKLPIENSTKNASEKAVV